MKLAWTEVAKSELAEIRGHPVFRWGPSVASVHLADLATAAKDAAANPLALGIRHWV